MRPEVSELVVLGPLVHDSLDADSQVLAEQERLLAAIATQPPTGEETKALAQLFPTDGGTAFGVAWRLLSIIESGDSWPDWDVLTSVEPEWQETLRVRLTNAKVGAAGSNLTVAQAAIVDAVVLCSPSSDAS